jgi:hypothetical protein
MAAMTPIMTAAATVRLRVRYEGYSCRETLWLARQLLTHHVSLRPPNAALRKVHSALVSRATGQLPSPAPQKHNRTIPSAEVTLSTTGFWNEPRFTATGFPRRVHSALPWLFEVVPCRWRTAAISRAAIHGWWHPGCSSVEQDRWAQVIEPIALNFAPADCVVTATHVEIQSGKAFSRSSM